MYKVIKLFTDLQDNNYKYEVGDEYPRLGLKPSIARITELSGSDNKQGTPLIEEVEDPLGKSNDDEQPESEPATPKRGRKKKQEK